ncbi:MAG: helix-turn-helix transcriptional regulator [Phycisphaerae bacterium]|jgi:transcriptional regulator with XRE-family HTH domain
MRRGEFRLLKKDVAEAAGVSYSQLNRWMNGHGEPSISQAAAMVLLVDASLDEIFLPDARAKRLAQRRATDRRRTATRRDS